MLKLNFVTIQDKIYINKKNKGKINACLYKQNNCMYILLPLINSYLIYPFFIFSKILLFCLADWFLPVGISERVIS